MDAITIVDSYLIWSITKINLLLSQYGDVSLLLNRPKWTIYIEWWLHNIGYYLTLPFQFLSKYNLRFKDVDLDYWVYNIRDLFDFL